MKRSKLRPVLGTTALIGALAGALLLGVPRSGAQESEPEAGITKTWALAECGKPLYAEGIEHFPYVNPDAPKGGSITLGEYGAFNTLNPLPPAGEEWPSAIGLISSSLMVGSDDELDAAYGLLAESAEYPEDMSWVIFNLRPDAHYDDGVPITAHDVKFAFDALKEHGRPFLKVFYEQIESAEVLDDHRIRFNMTTRNSMKPLVLAASMSPEPRHWWAERDISKATMEIPPSSGPYRISKVDPSRSITFERVKDYWGADLPVNVGRYNFDTIRYDIYLDTEAEFEAFKAGRIDFRAEGHVEKWMTQYDIPQVADGRIVKRELVNETPRGIAGYWINTRRPQFADVRVRRAIGYLYDFETLQRTLLFGKYKRIKSYFPNSDWGASGPPTPEELALLQPYADQLQPQVLTEAYEPLTTDGSGRIRENQRKALALFKEAGWVLKDGKLVNGETGEQLRVEILTGYPQWERITGQFIENMRQTGIDASLRFVDTSQWTQRGNDFDFDFMTGSLNFFPPPGAELRSYFSSQEADVRGSANLMGIEDPVVDALIEKVVETEDCEQKKVATRALDRVLLWGETTVPTYYNDQIWIAHWNRFGWPETKARYSVGFPSTYWMKSAETTSAQ